MPYIGVFERSRHMPNTARKRMTLADFLAWNPPGDTRWELYGGVPVAMAPVSRSHSRITSNVIATLSRALRDSPCMVFNEAGIRSPSRGDSWYEADIAVACRQDDSRPDLSDPVLVIEVLSPSTQDNDRKVKLHDYRRIPSVAEILLLDGASVFAELHRRLDDGRWTVDLYDRLEETLDLASVRVALPLAEIYRRVGFGETGV
jgi:Uma2 family endonuclease